MFWRGEEMFIDRREAGEQLAEALASLADEHVVVLGIPRGGVEVAAVVAQALHAPLDVVIPRKVGAPGNPELGLGAVAEDVEVLDQHLIRVLDVSEEYLRQKIADEREEIARRSALYRSGQPAVDLTGKVAVVVDDGVATGGTAAAALRWARAKGAKRVVLAVPVAPGDAVRRLKDEADEVRVLATPEPFFAVGQWYRSFPQIPDERVIQLLSSSAGNSR
jgi:putative phosphoribosyl transferase